MTESINYKIVIPCAGLGSRLNKLCLHINKALVSVGNKPVLSHIIEKFDKSIPIVIPLGYKGSLIKEYLSLAHPDRDFEYKEVDPFEGPKSGLGLSLLTVKDLLQCPFVFCSNDTIVEGLIPSPNHNWMGWDTVKDLSPYRSVDLSPDQKVTSINNKLQNNDFSKAYIGISGIRDWQLFWESMEESRNKGCINEGESYGLRALVSKTIIGHHFKWHDTGDIQNLENARKSIGVDPAIHILEKSEEAIWFVGGKVIKFSTDQLFIKKRVWRSEVLQPFVPKVIGSTTHMYAYNKIPGEMFSYQSKPTEFLKLLNWLKDFWIKAPTDINIEKKFYHQCMAFYRDKTMLRYKKYFQDSDHIDQEELINGSNLEPLYILLSKLDWEWLAKGMPVRFHGDLHFENIIINSENLAMPFTLLDWRQDFGDNTSWGDIYYDFAKLNHGLIVSHEIIENKLFSITQNNKIVTFDILQKQSLIDCQSVLRDWIQQNGYDWKKVEAITALIFINIAPLHHYPYSKFLIYLGREKLSNTIQDCKRPTPT